MTEERTAYDILPSHRYRLDSQTYLLRRACLRLKTALANEVYACKEVHVCKALHACKEYMLKRVHACKGIPACKGHAACKYVSVTRSAYLNFAPGKKTTLHKKEKKEKEEKTGNTFGPFHKTHPHAAATLHLKHPLNFKHPLNLKPSYKKAAYQRRPFL